MSYGANALSLLAVRDQRFGMGKFWGCKINNCSHVLPCNICNIVMSSVGYTYMAALPSRGTMDCLV